MVPVQAFTLPNAKLPTKTSDTPAQVPESSPPPAPASAAPPAAGPRMVLVDVVLLSVQELSSTSKGVNLLNALTFQLGNGNQPAFTDIHSYGTSNGAVTNLTTAITRAVSVPALTYSLNIANANNSFNEVLARPTLAAIEGQTSEFFSGTNLSAGVVSTSTQGGTTVVPLEKRFGIKLAVTPTFLPNGLVQLKVDAQRTALNANVDSPKVAYQVEIGEITANANVVMGMGETLVLSGLSEKASINTRDGVPLLQDLPLVQYAFSNKRTNDIQRSALILITPRAPAYTTLAQVSNSLKGTPLFREFREGDVVPERWERMDSTGTRLRQALELLYY
jgi:type II secretory pathway component GspD/PulD (secretin)